ncbi:glutaminase A [Leucobacter komagatae]|uniref:Glutaminase n=1 Tax=Leucobacter komagatae TaxID=55969 RepID=A0A0D0IK46_9MICO|nr:glutaminase A [Leucobacter komagatae]KIP51447.1 cyclic nucleotide-binding protein [Leucobacter komagatae]
MESPVLSYLREVHAELAQLHDGAPYSVGPASAEADPADFGIALATVDGHIYEVGTTRTDFSIQSISKPLSYGLAIADLGMAAVDAHVDVEPSGDPFNEISTSPETGRPANAMINAGAIAVASLIKGSGGRSPIQRIENTYSEFAARRIRSNGHEYRAERARSDRNHGLAYLLSSVGIIEGDPTKALETYLRQCAVRVDCRDLAMIAATLAAGGTNPVTGTEVLPYEAVERVLSVMMTSGMYDDAGDWATNVGMPAKSGVGGGIIAVLPGQVGLAVYSPPLDKHGNSVRGAAACRRISSDLQMHFVRAARVGRSAIRSTHTVDQEPSNIRRTEEAAKVLEEHGRRALVLDLTGDLFFAGTETVVRALNSIDDEIDFIVLDVRDVDEVGEVGTRMLGAVIDDLVASRRRILLVDPEGMLAGVNQDSYTVFDSHDRAIAHCERLIIERYGTQASLPQSVPVATSPVLAPLSAEDAERLTARMVPRHCSDGEVIRRVGQRFGGVFFIVAGAISIIASHTDGTRFRLRTLGAGMSFGELALGEDDRQETTAKAEGPVELMVLDAEAIEELEQEDPALAVQLWRALSRDAYLRVDRLSRANAARIRE